MPPHVRATGTAMNDIRVKAGSAIYEIIRDGGFSFDQVTTYVAPAVGPRWLIATGFDLTLMKEGILGAQSPVLLTGSSAGALRFAAWIQPEYEKSYRALMESYISMTFDRRDDPDSIQDAVFKVINSYIENDALPFALKNKRYRIAVTAARAKHLAASETTWLQSLGLGIAFVCNAIDRTMLDRFFERTVFYNGPRPPLFCLNGAFSGKTVLLNEANFKYALLASSSVPLFMAGVWDVFSAPVGVYRDGGLVDYHLNQVYAAKENHITLLFHHQERLIPTWLDRKLKSRMPPDSGLSNLLLIYPNEDFIAKLPDGKVPDREDFVNYMEDPKARIRNWRMAVEAAAPLGEQFMELVSSGRIRHAVEKLDNESRA